MSEIRKEPIHLKEGDSYTATKECVVITEDHTMADVVRWLVKIAGGTQDICSLLGTCMDEPQPEPEPNEWDTGKPATTVRQPQPPRHYGTPTHANSRYGGRREQHSDRGFRVTISSCKSCNDHIHVHNAQERRWDVPYCSKAHRQLPDIGMTDGFPVWCPLKDA